MELFSSFIYRDFNCYFNNFSTFELSNNIFYGKIDVTVLNLNRIIIIILLEFKNRFSFKTDFFYKHVTYHFMFTNIVKTTAENNNNRYN